MWTFIPCLDSCPTGAKLTLRVIVLRGWYSVDKEYAISQVYVEVISIGKHWNKTTLIWNNTYIVRDSYELNHLPWVTCTCGVVLETDWFQVPMTWTFRSTKGVQVQIWHKEGVETTKRILKINLLLDRESFSKFRVSHWFHYSLTFSLS